MVGRTEAGGSYGDLVQLFAVVGRRQGTLASCVAAVNGAIRLLQRFVSDVPYVVANNTLFEAGATVKLNFLRKSIPRMGPATAACKKVWLKSTPWKRTNLVTVPQVGIGSPFAPLRVGPDGLTFAK